MTEASLPASRLVENDFRVGRVFGRTSAVLARNFLVFFAVSVIASLPTILIVPTSPGDAAESLAGLGWAFLGLFLMLVLGTLSQAIVLYGAFQDMRGRRVDLAESVRVGLRQFFPIVGLAVSVTL